MICHACGMSEVGETATTKAYRLAVCRRCRMFEEKRNPKDVQRLPSELKLLGNTKVGRPPLEEMQARVAREPAPAEAKRPAAKPASKREA